MDIFGQFLKSGTFNHEVLQLILGACCRNCCTDCTCVTPSKYFREITCGTQERIRRLNEIYFENLDTKRKNSQSMLLFVPKIIIFQNFEPSDKITAKFTVTNISTNLVFLSMDFSESTHFAIHPPGPPSSRLAPGISLHFTLTFTPSAYKDYAEKVSFYTNYDKYILPILAFGPRLVLDIPDVINIPEAPVKIENTTEVTIRNIGLVAGGFTFICRCPFYVAPKFSFLRPGEFVDVKVSCKTMHLGEIEGKLQLQLETGEILSLRLLSSTYSVNIKTESRVIRVPETFNTMTQEVTFKISHSAPCPLTYLCMQHESVAEDFQEKLKLANVYNEFTKSESMKGQKLVEYDILSSGDHNRVYARIYRDELYSLIADETFLFYNKHFSVSPSKGILWPNIATQIKVIFSPQEVGDLEATVFLDIDGVFERIPFLLKGTSLRPDIRLNAEILNVNEVYINRNTNYEVVAMNKGLITGKITYKPSASLFDSTMDCIPKSLCLRPGQADTFVLSFCNAQLGPFFEDVFFHVTHGTKLVKLSLRGVIIYPRISFSLQSLDFGLVSIGVAETINFDVMNESDISVKIEIRVPSDGPEINSISLDEYAANNPKPELTEWPIEFNISPKSFNIQPKSNVTIQVTLTANLVRLNQTFLEFIVEESATQSYHLPVSYDAKISTLSDKKNIYIEAAFIKFTYKDEVVFTTDNVTGYYTLEIDQDETKITCQAEYMEGYLEPNTRYGLPIAIVVKELGEQKAIIRFKLFGSKHSIDICEIVAIGIPAIITYAPTSLQFGQIRVLKNHYKLLTLMNESPIEVPFTAHVHAKNEVLNLSATEAIIAPDSKYELTVCINLRDAVTVSNKLIIRIDKLDDIVVLVTAIGTGTSIVVGNYFEKGFVDLGRHFTQVTINCKVPITNEGTRSHNLEWNSQVKQATHKSEENAKTFSLSPLSLKLEAGETSFLEVVGHFNKPDEVEETWYMFGNIEGTKRKEMLLECPFRAQFVNVKIQVSKSEMKFRYDFGPYNELYCLTDIFSIKNISTLPLDVLVISKEPFLLIKQRSYKVIDEEGEDQCNCICFNIEDLSIDKLMGENDEYTYKKMIDYLTKQPITPKRTTHLNFFENIHKIKSAFELTSTIEQHLEDNEAMKVQIVFDTTLHTTMKSKFYQEQTSIKFKGHTCKESVRTIGEINFPNISISPLRIDFGCVPVNGTRCKYINIANKTPLGISYRWHWQILSIDRLPSPIQDANNNNNIEQVKSESKYSTSSCLYDDKHVVDEFNSRCPTATHSSEMVTASTEDTCIKEIQIYNYLAPMVSAGEDKNFTWFSKMPESDIKRSVKNMFSVIPHRGSILPNQEINTKVIFHSDEHLMFKGKLVCDVLGGLSETVYVSAESSSLNFELGFQKVNCKIRAVHEHVSEFLQIKNCSRLPFQFKTFITDETNQRITLSRILETIPREKQMDGNEIISLEIKVYTGVQGYFEKKLMIQIGCLDITPIEVYGWGVIPQVYLFLPRAPNKVISVLDGYNAIAALSDEYLELVQKSQFIAGKNSFTVRDSLDENTTMYEDWYIWSENVLAPTLIDIEMAIERMLVTKYCNAHPENLKKIIEGKEPSFTNFQAIPYVMDFGVVITGTTTVREIKVLNYGPTNLRLQYIKNRNMPSCFIIKNCGRLTAGENSCIEVTFMPRVEEFPLTENSIATQIYFQVPFGVRIPVCITGICVVPCLSINTNKIDFGKIKCGNKVVISMPIKNECKSTCVWYASMKFKTHGPIPVTLSLSSGKFEPGEGDWIDIAYEPNAEVALEGSLIFKFHMNPTRTVIPIMGKGICPRVQPLGRKLSFTPMLPWALPKSLYFGLFNPCPFPIELIVAHSDTYWKQEQALYELLYKYYDKPEQILLPAINPVEGYPKPILDFYVAVNDGIKRRQEQIQKFSGMNSPPKKKAPTAKPYKSGAGATSFEENKRRDEDILSDIFREFKSLHIDPLSEAINGTKNTNINDKKHGAMILFQASPCCESEALRLAYVLGRELRLPVINVDSNIIEALSTIESSTTDEILHYINEKIFEVFQTLQNHLPENENISPEEFEVCEMYICGDCDDEYSRIQKKITFIQTNQNNVDPKKKTSEKDKKKKPSSASTQSSSNIKSTSSLLPCELITSLLTDFYSQDRFANGFIVDCLKSDLLTPPSTTLTTFLKTRPDFEFYQLILCNLDLNVWRLQRDALIATADEIVPPLSKEYQEEEIVQIVEDISEMSASQYSLVPPELKNIFVSVGLEERRKKIKNILHTDDSDMKTKKPAQSDEVKKKKDESSKKNEEVPKGKDLRGGKIPSDVLQMNLKFNEYQKNVLEDLLMIACNWSNVNGEIVFPLLTITGQEAAAPKKKDTKKKDGSQPTQAPEEQSCDKGIEIAFIEDLFDEKVDGIAKSVARQFFLQKSLMTHISPSIMASQPKKKEYTIFLPREIPQVKEEECLHWKFLDAYPVKHCECNETDKYQKLPDKLEQDAIMSYFTNWRCRCEEISESDSSPQTSSRQQNIIGNSTGASLYNGRYILQHGDLIRCKVTCEPKEEGIIEFINYIEATGWPHTRIDVSITAICDLPRIDTRPKKMFDHFLRKAKGDRIYKSVYLNELRLFEFGPIFLGLNRVLEENYYLNIKNISLLEANVDYVFLEDNQHFVVGNTLPLQPEEKCKLRLSAAPETVGTITNQLLCCIKDNPEIVSIDLRCTGVTADIEIIPKTDLLEFPKKLLNHQEIKEFVIKNNSLLPIMWKIRDYDLLSNIFSIIPIKHIVQRNNEYVVQVIYRACQVGHIVDQQLIIDIYDERGIGNAIMTKTLLIKAECYDVEIDITFQYPEKPYLDYGEVKVNTTQVQQMFILNKGLYNCFYKLKKVKKFPEPSFLKTFEVKNISGKLMPTLKPITVDFYCNPNKDLSLKNVQAYTCCIMDDSDDQTIVAEIPVNLRIIAKYNTFQVQPFGELNFGVCSLDVLCKREITIINTNNTPIVFDIELPDKDRDSVTEKATPKLGKGKATNALRCGNFTLMNNDYLIAPESSRIIEVQFLATMAERYEEIITFKVNDVCPTEASGVPLKLVATGALPSLDFWNTDITFREHLIVKNIKDYTNTEPVPHAVFSESTVTMHFYGVIVNNEFIARLHLYNNGLVPSDLTMKLNYQANSNSSIFFLDKYSLIIEPLHYDVVGISFAPKALEEYRTVLEIRLQQLKHEKVFQICLIGEGIIPRIQIIQPKIELENKGYLEFPSTFLESSSQKTIQLKNISGVHTRVLIDIHQSGLVERPVFWLLPSEETEPYLTMWDNVEFTVAVNMILPVASESAINVFFGPSQQGLATCNIRVIVVNNPYETFSISCTAEAFVADLALIGIKMLPLNSVNEGSLSPDSGGDKVRSSKGAKKVTETDKKQIKKINEPSRFEETQNELGEAKQNCLLYEIDFGGCTLNVIHKRAFTMINYSDKVYQFKWETAETIVIKPKRGYIMPGEEKDIALGFYSEIPIQLIKEKLTCQLLSMSDDFKHEEIHGSIWDTRQNMTVFKKTCENLHQRADKVLEDPFNLASIGTETMKLVILFSVNGDTPKFITDLPEEIVLRETLMYQKRYIEFNMKNIGEIPFNVYWNFIVDQDYPVRAGNLETDLQVEECKIHEEISSTPDTLAEEAVPTLFSFNMSQRDSADTWFEADLPFTIEPSDEYFGPGENKMFKIIFAPRDAFLYNVLLQSSFGNLEIDGEIPKCKIRVKSLVPYCHLDVEESDYITAGRRMLSDLSLPHNTRVIEFNVVGPGCYYKKFRILNPTEHSYDFEIRQQTSDGNVLPIHCDKMQDFLEAGSSVEICFSFAPNMSGLTIESLWKLIIQKFSLEVNLLVVGIVREPDVVFIPNILKLNNTLVGIPTSNTTILKNNEHMPLKVTAKGNSLQQDDGKISVYVEPESSTIDPCSELPIRITYKPTKAQEVSFKVFFDISCSSSPLTLRVNALSHEIKPIVKYFIGARHEHQLRSDAVTNIYLNETALTYARHIKFVLKNNGSTTFMFKWRQLASPVKKYIIIEFTQDSGFVTPGEEIEIVLSCTIKDVPIVGCPVKLCISDGPEYEILINADIKKPLYKFSAGLLDFGKCIVNATDSAYQKYLIFSNKDNSEIRLDLDFDNVRELDVNIGQKPFVISKKENLKIIISFKPKKAEFYKFKVRFLVNSLCEEIITVIGEGVPLLLDVYEGCQKFIDLGSVRLGTKTTKEVEIYNLSKVTIDATFHIESSLAEHEVTCLDSEAGSSICLFSTEKIKGKTEDPQFQSRVKSSKEYKRSKERTQLKTDIANSMLSLQLSPKSAIIPPHQKISVKIKFKPVAVINKFYTQLCVKVFDITKPVAQITGSATGMNLELNTDTVPFGLVRKNEQKSLKTTLHNKGDYIARFYWQPLRSNLFFISPMEGVVPPRSSITFTITFRPTYYNAFIKEWASCNIKKFKNLNVSLYGSCLQVNKIDTRSIKFDCPVREISEMHVNMHNSSADVWTVTSTLSGDPTFETLKTFTIEPRSSIEVPIRFKPLTVGLHEVCSDFVSRSIPCGSIEFSPLGEAMMLCNLVGLAKEPLPNAVLHIQVASKSMHSEILGVYCLTGQSETYTVHNEIIKVTPSNFNSYYEINCPEEVNVWGDATASVKWTFISYAECTMLIRLVFANEMTQEIQYYMMDITVTPSDYLDTINLISKARQSVQVKLNIVNPLTVDAVFTTNCQHPDVTVANNILVHKLSDAPLTITYLPLVVGEYTAVLELREPTVGSLLYKLMLTCLPPDERNVEVSAMLGSAAPLRLRVFNNLDKNADFECKTTHPSLLTDKSYNVKAKEKTKILVYYEPTDIGEQRGKISLESPTAGFFVFNIIGKGLYPKPQGPFEIKLGGSKQIKFKNIFDKPRTFIIYIDNQEFTVQNKYELIPAKKEILIVVSLKTGVVQESRALPTGCFKVQCAEYESITWTYFLQGVV